MGNMTGTMLEIKDTCAQVEEFFQTSLPAHIRKTLGNKPIVKMADQQEIMRAIDFTPPFLRIEKMALIEMQETGCLSYGLGMGKLYPEDTERNYSKPIELVMSGWLMASCSSIHMAFLYSQMAPQVVKADGVVLMGDIHSLNIPTDRKARFFVETIVIRKKMRLIIAETRIWFRDYLYSIIRELKIFLTEKDSIWHAKTVPSFVEKIPDFYLYNEVECFLGTAMPGRLKQRHDGLRVVETLETRQIIEKIQSSLSFLRIDKAVVLADKKGQRIKTVGVGVAFPEDTQGHYNSTLFLAMCGKFIGMCACIHAVAYSSEFEKIFYVSEVNNAVPLVFGDEKTGLWKPAEHGTIFFVETEYVRQTKNVVYFRGEIFFEDILFARLGEVKIIMVLKDAVREIHTHLKGKSTCLL